MNSDQILIISFWNPTARHPQQGIFIQEQAAAVCDMRENIIFLQVNILPSRNIFLKKTYEEAAYFKNKRITINLYSRLWKFWYVNPWSVSRIILRLIRKNKGEIAPAIIHANVIFPCGVTGYLLARKLGARLLISEHWSKTGKLLGHPLYKRIAMKAYLYSFAVICVSEFLSERLSRSTGHKNLIVIPNIIDTDIYSYKQKPTSGNSSLSMVCIANWKLPKRLDLIIESLISFASESSLKIELTVVGNGPQADMLRKRETPENLKIRWTGYLDRSAIAPLLQGANIFLHASDIETFSIVTAEALSTGTPVLASNTGALPELINEQNGILVENNHESWLNGIREIVTKEYDYEVIAHQNQNKYSPRQIGNRILSIYDSINTGKS
ncbi:MAG: glycosyltransferase family 4 protein [Bacteroidales bacterium]|nr:glycosyltransferase family 4 protein [Bacteroidales bacterium]